MEADGGFAVRLIDIDSHSRAGPEGYVVEPQYKHLRPTEYIDAEGWLHQVFANRTAILLSPSEMKPGYQGDRRNWYSGNYDASVRFKHVSEAGIDLQFISVGIVSEFNYVEPDVGAAFCRAANNFVYERFMEPYPDRFTGVPQLPVQDVRLALAELERCTTELRMRTFLMPTNVEGIDMAAPALWPFWRGVLELGIGGVIVHFGTMHGPWVGQERLPVLDREGTTAKRIVSGPFEYWTNVCNLLFSGLMDVYPDLRFAFLEVGADCMMLLKRRLAENLGQIGYLRDMLAHALDWYFDRFYFLADERMLQNDGEGLRQAVREFGSDHLFVGSDYPHPDGSFEPFYQIEALTWLSSDEKEQILGKNVERLIGL
jgi:aminocarboxymuconate-semialdehyde decarboxylase